MKIEVNISDYATGGVLSIEYKDRRQRLIAYLSKLLNEMEYNYEIHNKKMLAVIRELKTWMHLLKATKFKFEIQMDYKNLEYFIKALKLNQEQARQILYLSKFNLTLKHILGVRIEKVNRLSKMLDLKVEIENNYKNQNLIKEEQIRVIMEVVVERLKIMLVKKIKRAREKDKEVVGVVEKIKKSRS